MNSNCNCPYFTQLAYEEFAHTFCFHLTKTEHLADTMQAKMCKKVGKEGVRLLVTCTHCDRLFFPSWALFKANKELKKIFITASSFSTPRSDWLSS